MPDLLHALRYFQRVCTNWTMTPNVVGCRFPRFDREFPHMLQTVTGSGQYRPVRRGHSRVTRFPGFAPY